MARHLPPLGLRPFDPAGADTSAVIYRNFIKDSGTRAIGVGYPEKVNLSFDANEMRLSLLWQGALHRRWPALERSGRGLEGPLATTSWPYRRPELRCPRRAERRLADAGTEGLGYRFLGYRLTPDDRPNFRYSLERCHVRGLPQPGSSPARRPSERTLQVSAKEPVDNLYFRAAVGNKIEASARVGIGSTAGR